MSEAPHSARVRLWMEFEGGDVHFLDQVADRWVMPSAPLDHPPTEARLVMEIDGRRHERRVTLPEGMRPEDRRVPVREIPASAGRQSMVG